jgi:hypothetical protein
MVNESDSKAKNPEWEEFYAVVGQALYEWQLVEGEVGNLFSVFMEDPGGELANAAYHSIQSFRLRLGMANATASVFFRNHHYLQKRWDDLYKMACKMNKKRNCLAHYMTGVRGA